LDSAKYIGIE